MKHLVTALIFAIFSCSSFALTSTEFVKKESADVLTVVQRNKDLNSFKKDLSTSVKIDELIDFLKISKLTLGKNWRKAEQAQQDAFVKEFREFLINFYGNAMFQFKDAQIDYKSESIDGEYATVKTVVSYRDGGAKRQAKVDYQLVKTENTWKMVDVVIEGITLTLSYKDQFGQVVNQKGIDGLIQELKDKNSKNSANKS